MYDEATNAWILQSQTPFAAATKHGYDHITFDSLRGKLWHHPGGTGNGRYTARWDGGSTWTNFSFSSNVGTNSSGTVAMGIEFFPDLGANGTVLHGMQEEFPNGQLFGLDPVTGVWNVYAQPATLTNFGQLHSFILYSPIHKVCLFGGGDGSDRLWKITASGSVAPCASFPAAFSNGVGAGDNDSLPVINPSNGNLIVIRDVSTWYEYDVSANSWSAKSGTASVLQSPVYNGSAPAWGTVAATLHEYGVIVFIKCYNGAGGVEMWLFKP
jgi:hypothetical protein